MAWKFWKIAMLHRGSMNMANGKMKSWVVNRFVKDWKKGRSALKFPAKSFNEQWKENNK